MRIVWKFMLSSTLKLEKTIFNVVVSKPHTQPSFSIQVFLCYVFSGSLSRYFGRDFPLKIDTTFAFNQVPKRANFSSRNPASRLRNLRSFPSFYRVFFFWKFSQMKSRSFRAVKKPFILPFASASFGRYFPTKHTLNHSHSALQFLKCKIKYLLNDLCKRISFDTRYSDSR